MKHLKLLALLCALAAVGAAPAASPLAAVAPPTAALANPSICHATASAARQAARRDAQAEYWIAIANCLNAPDSSHCEHDAAQAREEAFKLADDQYHSRLDACGMLGQGAYDPGIVAGDFSTTIDNAFNPLVPGRTLVYEQHGANGVEHDEVTTLAETIDVDGVQCRKVHDVVTLDGVLEEDALDLFAQQSNGDVWYFAEVSQSFADGLLDNIDGSWRTGKDGAKPGIIMLSNPQLGDVYRQEFLIGEAEDIAKIVATDETVTVPAGTFQHCLKTREWSPIEPDQIEFKYYAAGIGVVLEVTADTGERLELVQIIN